MKTIAIELLKEQAVDEFIDNLITVLESHGIDATNWDGEDAPHIIVANGIVFTIEIEKQKAYLAGAKAMQRQAADKCYLMNIHGTAKLMNTSADAIKKRILAINPEALKGGEG